MIQIKGRRDSLKILLFVLPILVYLFNDNYLKNKYHLSKERSKLMFFLSIPIYMTFTYFYSFSFTTLIYSLALSLVFSISAIDIDKHIIPNRLVLGLLFLGAVNLAININDAKLLIFGFVLTFIFGVIIYFTTRGSIGGGDVKLLSALGLLVGYYNIYIIIFISFLLAALFGIVRILSKKANAKTSIPFGPFIALGFLVISFI